MCFYAIHMDGNYDNIAIEKSPFLFFSLLFSTSHCMNFPLNTIFYHLLGCSWEKRYTVLLMYVFYTYFSFIWCIFNVKDIFVHLFLFFWVSFREIKSNFLMGNGMAASAKEKKVQKKFFFFFFFGVLYNFPLNFLRIFLSYFF